MSGALITFLTPNFTHTDERGGLIQLVREGWKQVNYISSVAGCVRGGHYHKYNKEAFFIIKGSIELTLEKEQQKETHVIKAGTFFMIPPYVKHYFKYLENTELISLYDVGVEMADNTKDIYS